MTDEPKTHDVSLPGWGRNISVLRLLPNDRAQVAGWLTPIPSEGDFLILNGNDGTNRTTRYLIDSIKPCWNPPDMFFAEISFAPRPPETGENDPSPSHQIPQGKDTSIDHTSPEGGNAGNPQQKDTRHD